MIVIVPAFQEGARIRKTLMLLKHELSKGNIHGVVVVDDGSTDRTHFISSEFARTNTGFSVLKHDSNLGKADAIITGLFHAKQEDATIAILLDADLHRYSDNAFEQLLNPLHDQHIQMVVGAAVEGKGNEPRHLLSGQRALRLTALNPLFVGKPKWVGLLKGRRFGVEVALNRLIPTKATVLSDAVFFHASPFRSRNDELTNMGVGNQTREMFEVKSAIEERDFEARKKKFERDEKRRLPRQT
ncbi:MAG: glycosyltransferase family 2 protein [Candidatus Micrarchaeota archaeon]